MRSPLSGDSHSLGSGFCFVRSRGLQLRHIVSKAAVAPLGARALATQGTVKWFNITKVRRTEHRSSGDTKPLHPESLADHVFSSFSVLCDAGVRFHHPG